MRTVLLTLGCALVAACAGLTVPTAEELERDAAIRPEMERCIEDKLACYGAFITDTEGRIYVVTLGPGAERDYDVNNLEATGTYTAGFSNFSDITFRSDPEWETIGVEYLRQRFRT